MTLLQRPLDDRILGVIPFGADYWHVHPEALIQESIHGALFDPPFCFRIIARYVGVASSDKFASQHKLSLEKSQRFQRSVVKGETCSLTVVVWKDLLYQMPVSRVEVVDGFMTSHVSSCHPREEARTLPEYQDRQ